MPNSLNRYQPCLFRMMPKKQIDNLTHSNRLKKVSPSSLQITGKRTLPTIGLSRTKPPITFILKSCLMKSRRLFKTLRFCQYISIIISLKETRFLYITNNSPRSMMTIRSRPTSSRKGSLTILFLPRRTWCSITLTLGRR